MVMYGSFDNHLPNALRKHMRRKGRMSEIEIYPKNQFKADYEPHQYFFMTFESPAQLKLTVTYTKREEKKEVEIEKEVPVPATSSVGTDSDSEVSQDSKEKT